MSSIGDCPTIPASPLDNSQLNNNLKNELNAEVIHIPCLLLLFHSISAPSLLQYFILIQKIRIAPCTLMILTTYVFNQ